MCSFQFLPGIASAAFLRSESHGTHDHILLSHLRLPQLGGPGSCIYFPNNRVAQLYPQAEETATVILRLSQIGLGPPFTPMQTKR
jgi:hypothetical protein